MAQTTNIGLYKLGAQSKLKDFPSLFNDDLDIIDSTLGYGFGQGGNPTVKACVDALNSNITKNSYPDPSTWTELSYNVSFTIPDDGYIRVRNQASSTPIEVNINGYSGLSAPIGTNLLCFVRKGMTARKNTDAETVHFIPLV